MTKFLPSGATGFSNEGKTLPKSENIFFVNPDKKLKNDEVLALDSAKSYFRKQVTKGTTVTFRLKL